MSRLTREQFVERFKTIKMLALDVDGVLTDDSIYFGPDGFEMKRFNISDGFFIVLAMRSELEVAVVSGRYSAATDTRMKDLGVKHVLQEMKNKVDQITPLLKKLGIKFEELAFVGNELLDIPLVEKAGLGIAVADSATGLLEVADYVTAIKGGHGAVREVVEAYFESRGKSPRDFVI